MCQEVNQGQEIKPKGTETRKEIQFFARHEGSQGRQTGGERTCLENSTVYHGKSCVFKRLTGMATIQYSYSRDRRDLSYRRVAACTVTVTRPSFSWNVKACKASDFDQTSGDPFSPRVKLILFSRHHLEYSSKN
jgi:hypothetical protein